jgi:hypothetical protein
VTLPTTTPADDAFSERMKISGDLGAHLCEYLWSELGVLRLNGREYEMAGDDVPGYEDDDWAVLLRRKSDGKVFEATIDVDIQPARETERSAATP